MANYRSHDKAFWFVKKKGKINFWSKSVIFSFTWLAKCKVQSHWGDLGAVSSNIPLPEHQVLNLLHPQLLISFKNRKRGNRWSFLANVWLALEGELVLRNKNSSDLSFKEVFIVWYPSRFLLLLFLTFPSLPECTIFEAGNMSFGLTLQHQQLPGLLTSITWICQTDNLTHRQLPYWSFSSKTHKDY